MRILRSPAAIDGNGTAGAVAAAATVAEPKTSLAAFTEAARKSIAEEHPLSDRAVEAAALADPVVDAGLESPPAKTPEELAAEAAATEESARVAALTPEELLAERQAAEAAAIAAESDEPTAEELAGLSEGGKRALVREREARKAAKAETKALRDELAALRAELKLAPKPKPVVQAALAAPSAEAGALGDCETFEAVDARVMQAATTETQILSVRKTLARTGVEAAAEQLKKLGVTKVAGMPLAEADENAITDFLDTATEGVRATQAQAAPRKSFIAQQHASWAEAVKIMPELDDMKSDFCRQVQHFVTNSPQLRGRANWPVLAVKFVMGNAAFNLKAKPATAAPVKVAAVVPKPAPGAPKRAAGAAVTPDPQAAIRAKMANGTATLAEVQALAKANIGVAA